MYTYSTRTPTPRTELMKTLIAERTARSLAQRKHYTCTFRHMACGPTDGHTHMVLVAPAASHGRKALCSPLIELQITEHSTQSTAWKSLTVWVASFCPIIKKQNKTRHLPLFIVWKQNILLFAVINICICIKFRTDGMSDDICLYLVLFPIKENLKS